MSRLTRWLPVAFLIAGIGSLISRYPIAVCSFVIAIALCIAGLRVVDYRRFRTRGFRVRPQGRDSFLYEEQNGPELRSVPIYGELYAVGPSRLYVPSLSDWERTVPDWAQNRRDEIFARVRSELGENRWVLEDKKQ